MLNLTIYILTIVYQIQPNNEVSLLISEYDPSVFCFQESGGASIFVKSSFLKELQATAVSVILDRK